MNDREAAEYASKIVTMKRIINLTTAFTVALTILFGLWNRLHPSGALLSLTITLGTISYHFLIRLLIGLCFNLTMRNRADYHAAWFQPRAWERPLYDRLKVKRWKKRMPTYQPELFDPRLHTWGEIAQSMCQAELVHETIVIASFLPLLVSVWFGAFWVFLITSVFAALLDLVFVIMQRFNRPAVVRIAEREKRRKGSREINI